MLTAEMIACSLDKARKSGNGWQACCPAHDDKNPSLSITEGNAGQILVHCYAGCSQEDVVSALREKSLWPENERLHSDKRPNDNGRDSNLTRVSVVPPGAPDLDAERLIGFSPTSLEAYRTVEGDLIGYVARIESASGKSFRPITLWRDSTGKMLWRRKGFGSRLPLFRQERLAQAPDASVLVVEGEKATKAAEKLFPDHIVVSWPSGSASAGKADWQVLAKRDVILWPDADEPGQKAMQEVAKALLAAGSKSIRKVALPGSLPRGWDLADEAPEGLDVADALKSAGDCDPTLGQYFLTAKQLLALPIRQQEFLIEPFMPSQSLSMVFAERGLGKTWLCMTLSLALAKGEPFFQYKVPQARRVLYVDGEMALNELQWRQRALDPNPPETLEYLPSELLYQRKASLNLHDAKDQERLMAALARREALDKAPELIVIDNLSSLARGVDENSNSDLDPLLQFLLNLRHSGYSVLLVHHAGKNKEQRGASRREDFLNLSIELRRPDKSTDKKYKDESALQHDGAHFILKFSKVRGRPPKPPMLDLKLREADGRVEWLIDGAPHATQADQVLRYIAECSPQTQKQIAEDFNVTPGYISQICSSLSREGCIEKAKAKGPTITQKGRARLVEVWPELAGQIHWQDEFDKIL